MLRFQQILCIVTLSAFCACASERVVHGFRAVEPGMTQVEVIDLLGEPSSRWSLSQPLDGRVGERLQGGDGASSLASSAMVRGDPDRAYSVVFDGQGKVVSKTEPTWVEETKAGAMVDKP